MDEATGQGTSSAGLCSSKVPSPWQARSPVTPEQQSKENKGTHAHAFAFHLLLPARDSAPAKTPPPKRMKISKQETLYIFVFKSNKIENVVI